MRRASPNSALYQVDLIAALFAGFIVVWLATSSDADPADDDQEPTYISIEVQRVSATDGYSWSLVDRGAVRAGCAPASLVEKFSQVIRGATPCRVDKHGSAALIGAMLKDIGNALQKDVDLVSPNTKVMPDKVIFSHTAMLDEAALHLDNQLKPLGTFLVPSHTGCVGLSEKSSAVGLMSAGRWFAERSLYLVKDPEALLSGAEIKMMRVAQPVRGIALKEIYTNASGNRTSQIGHGLEYPWDPSCDKPSYQEHIRVCVLNQDSPTCFHAAVAESETSAILQADSQ